ncbi:MAG: hypothetical protein FJZ07_02790 [Candidatus Nealsonbacteria bacterium]|nr:hypothetical protein [Candidatus Nealsonbacteria bacterium]
MPNFLSSLANFDGIHYLLIAQRGYAQHEQAFFPLYPLIIKMLAPIFFNNTLLAALVVSNISLFFALFMLLKYIGLISPGSNKFLLILTVLVFPTSFYFGAVYTEGLFFFLFVVCLYFLKKRNYFLAGFFAFLASLTRLVGVFIIIPIIFHLLNRKPIPTNSRRQQTNSANFKLILTVISPILGLFVYCLYLWYTTGDPLLFFHSQPTFGANRSTRLIFLPQVYFRYLKIFLTANMNFQYLVSVFEFLVFNLVFIVLIFDLLRNFKLKIINLDRLGLALFSVANLLLPTLTGTLSSMPRYALLSVSFFIFITEIKNHWFKAVIWSILAVFHILALGFFIQGYFVS